MKLCMHCIQGKPPVCRVITVRQSEEGLKITKPTMMTHTNLQDDLSILAFQWLNQILKEEQEGFI
jgi:hypothetical protein